MPQPVSINLGCEFLDRIDTGGMGKVHGIRDPRFRRNLASKGAAERFAGLFATTALNHLKIGFLLLLVCVSTPLSAKDSFAGTWGLNVAKSKLAGPYSTLESENLIIKEQGSLLLIRANVTRQDGSAANSVEEVSRNGGALNYIAGSLPPGVSRRVKRVNSDALEITTLRNGVRIQVDSVVVSGREMRITRHGVAPNAMPFESTEVLKRK